MSVLSIFMRSSDASFHFSCSYGHSVFLMRGAFASLRNKNEVA